MKQPMEKKWDWEISSETANWSWDLKSLLSYRHLLASLVRKEFLLNYQQTILGPGWILVQPLLTLVTYVLVFAGNLVLLVLLVESGMLDPIFGQIVAFSTVTLLSYLLQNHWVFRDKG